MYEAHAPNTNVTQFPYWHSSQSIQPKTQIVVPCYNEAKRLDADAFLAFLDGTKGIGFIFVNDGSTDATLEKLLALQSVAPQRVTVLDLTVNGGKAEAVRQGLILATDSGADFVGYWDADLATPLDAIGDFVRIAAKFPDTQVVYGARRMLLGHRITRTLGRRIVSRTCALLARQAVRLPIGDTQCGAKLFRAGPLASSLFAEPFVSNWVFDVEILARLIQSRRRDGGSPPNVCVRELPLLQWVDVAGSKVRPLDFVRAVGELLRIRARYLRGA